MLQKELEERLGKKVTDEEYCTANAMYMNTDMDKDIFCKEYAKHGDSPMVRELSDKATTMYAQAQMAKNRAAQMEDEMFEMGFELADIAYTSDMRARHLALRMLGETAFLRYILQKGYELTEDDRNMIVDRINEKGEDE